MLEQVRAVEKRLEAGGFMPRQGVVAGLVLVAGIGVLSGSQASAQPPAEQRRVPPPTGTPRHVALVVGNDAYARGPLRNAVNDARAMSRVLSELGFVVETLENTTRVRLARAVDGFVGRLGAGDVGFFYYAGHGIQVEGENYLLPVDFSADDETTAKYESLPADLIRERMEKSGARLNVIVLDACRDNPFRFTRSGSGGLAAMTGGRGTLIAFATGPGRTASDNAAAGNGLFTLHLVEALRVPGLKLAEVFDRAREKVDEVSAHKQIPWTVSSVIGEFYFRPPQAGVAPTPAPASVAPAAPGPVRPFLGFRFGPLTPALATKLGLPELGGGGVLTEVDEGGPAWQAGLRKDDVIRSLDGQILKKTTDILDESLKRSVGDEVKLEVWRGGRPLAMTVVLGNGLSFYGTRCEGGNATACVVLAGYYAGGQGVPKDAARAATLYRQACDSGDGPACAWLASLYRAGEGVAKDEASAAAYYVRACDAGYGDGCNGAGYRYSNGVGVPKDVARANVLFQKGCEGGSAGGCNNLGSSYLRGDGVTKDVARAVDLFRRSCDGGFALGCANLGTMYESGTGVSRDKERARGFYKQACDAGDAHGCSYLGRMYESGTGVSRDRERARDLYKKACDAGDATSCEHLKKIQ